MMDDRTSDSSDITDRQGNFRARVVARDEHCVLTGAKVLCHGRDIHLTWVKSFTKTLGSGFRVLSTRAKSEEDFDSY